MNISLNNKDATAFLQSLEANSIDSIVTDPPYGWSFMGKKWDYDLPSVATFQEMLRVLKPGGHILCACGTRTQHRMAVKIEDAGFEIRDVVSWVYGSGFPKSQSIGKQIDKMQGNEREDIGIDEYRAKRIPNGRNIKDKQKWNYGSDRRQGEDFKITKGHTEYEGFGTALKPAQDFFTLARKPISEKNIAENVLKWGTGAINIDGSRVGTQGGTKAKNFGEVVGNMYGNGKGKPKNEIEEMDKGRFPANFIHDGSDEVVGLFPNTGTSKGGNSTKKGGFVTAYKDSSKEGLSCGFGDSGSAARFFYCAKASKAQRTENGQVENNHPTVKPLELMKYLCRLITPPEGTVLDPYMGSGTTGVACVYEGFRFIGNDADSGSLSIAEKRIALNRTNKEGTQLNLI